MRWFQGYRSASWRVDETYVRVGGAWNYLFLAVDKTGRLIDLMLSERRDTRAAHRFLAIPPPAAGLPDVQGGQAPHV